MRGEGFLGIWSDVEPDQETDYLHWLTREHTSERMGVEGFEAVRVFRALDDRVRRFFILYELTTPEALTGPSYLARLNDPTPWSRRIMPILGNFVRGGGLRTISRGAGRGGHAAALPFPAALANGKETVEALIARDRIARVHLLETDEARTSVQTNEKRLRPKDDSFHSLLLVEGLDPDAVARALDAVGLPSAGPHYSLVFALEA